MLLFLKFLFFTKFTQENSLINFNLRKDELKLKAKSTSHNFKLRSLQKCTFLFIVAGFSLYSLNSGINIFSELNLEKYIIIFI